MHAKNSSNIKVRPGIYAKSTVCSVNKKGFQTHANNPPRTSIMDLLTGERDITLLGYLNIRCDQFHGCRSITVNKDIYQVSNF